LSRWVRDAIRHHDLAHVDALHVYTQHAALLSTESLRARPSVVSTDASGVQANRLHPGRVPTRFTPARIRLTGRLERRVFDAATLVVAQSQWAAASLRDDYGIAGERITVVPFGIMVPPEPPRRQEPAIPR